MRARRCRASKARRNTPEDEKRVGSLPTLFVFTRAKRQRTCPEPEPVAEPEPLSEPDPEPLAECSPAWPLIEPLPFAVPLPEQAARANDRAIAAILSRAVFFMVHLLAIEHLAI